MLSAKITVTVDFGKIDIEKAFGDVIKIIAQRIDNELVPELLTQLGDYPGKPSYPLRWKSAKQRRYVMMMLRKQNNIPYQRTGRLRDSWEAIKTITSTSYELAISSTWAESVYVVGDISTANVRESIIPQQPFHQDTGWQPATATVSTFFDRAVDLAEDELAQRFEEVMTS